MILFMILAIEEKSDRDLMISIYTELYPLMKSTAFQIVKDNQVAEDMVHDTIVEMIRSLDTIRGYEWKRLISYIVKAVKNNALDYYHRKRTEQNHTFYGYEDDTTSEIPDNSAAPFEHIEITEEYEALGLIMKQLPERERELLNLKYGLQYSDEKISAILGIKKDSVRQYLTRARRLAKEYLLRR